ncbi:MAG: hypothetical protein ABI054_14325 [Planctomycetota bacterium]
MARSSTEDRIKRLEDQIRTIKERAERKSVRSNPAIKFMAAALRSIEKAMKATEDAALRKALDEARATVSACLSLSGVTAKSARGVLTPRARSSSAATGRPDAESLLKYVKSNPGSRSEELTAAMGTDAASIRPLMHALIADGQVRTEGQRRGMRYF